jgi:hypothetical protein
VVVEHHVRGDVGERATRARHVIEESLEQVEALPHLVADERAGRVLGRFVALDAEGRLAGPPRRGQGACQEAERRIGTRGSARLGAEQLVRRAPRIQGAVVGLGPEAGPGAAMVVVDIVPLFVDVCVGEVDVDRARRVRRESPRLVGMVRGPGNLPEFGKREPSRF